ncbi:MAG: sulfur modification protein DndC [Blastocatellia bacterium]
MEAMVDNGEAWLEPLLEFRDHLAATIDPERKREYRDIKGRDGRVIINKEGSAAVARTYKLEASQDMLERLLRAQQAVRRSGPNPNETLIAEEELHEIRRLWRTERQDWEDSVPKIFRQVMGHDLEWPVDDDVHFDTDQKTLLANICNEYDVPFSLVAKMLEAERRAAGMARRASIQKSLDAVLNEEWRSEVEIIKYKREEQLPLP